MNMYNHAITFDVNLGPFSDKKEIVSLWEK